MRKGFAFLVLVGLILFSIGLFLSLMESPNHPARSAPPDPAVLARIRSLEAEVDMLKARQDATEALVKRELAIMAARVAIVDARTLAIARVVPVEAIRDRARQR